MCSSYWNGSPMHSSRSCHVSAGACRKDQNRDEVYLAGPSAVVSTRLAPAPGSESMAMRGTSDGSPTAALVHFPKPENCQRTDWGRAAGASVDVDVESICSLLVQHALSGQYPRRLANDWSRWFVDGRHLDCSARRHLIWAAAVNRNARRQLQSLPIHHPGQNGQKHPGSEDRKDGHNLGMGSGQLKG